VRLVAQVLLLQNVDSQRAGGEAKRRELDDGGGEAAESMGTAEERIAETLSQYHHHHEEAAEVSQYHHHHEDRTPRAEPHGAEHYREGRNGEGDGRDEWASADEGSAMNSQYSPRSERGYTQGNTFVGDSLVAVACGFDGDGLLAGDGEYTKIRRSGPYRVPAHEDETGFDEEDENRQGTEYNRLSHVSHDSGVFPSGSCLSVMAALVEVLNMLLRSCWSRVM